MTFAEYNTDKNFDDNKSSLEELVKIGLKEGKTSDEIKKSLSPKWQKSKKIGEFDNYVSMYSKPEPKKEEVKENITADVDAPTNKVPALSKDDAKHFNQIDSIAKNAEKTELENIENQSNRNWKSAYDTISKQGELFGQIDDKLVAQFPTFVVKRYADGEFGDPKSKDAKLRLAHFMINGLGTALSNMSHVINKDGGREMSDYEKFQQTNLAQGLENRWNKYKQETQTAIDLAKKEGMTEQDARLAVQRLTRDNSLNTKWNIMNEKQKLYALSITKEMGDYIGDLGADELANFVAGAALNENNISKDEVIAIGIAKLASKSPEILANLPEGGVKDLVASMIGGNGIDAVAGIGGAGGSSEDTGTSLEDGTKVDPGKSMSKQELEDLRAEANKLGDKYYNGEITEEEFRKDYAKLEDVMNKHGVRKAVSGGIMSADNYIKQIHTNKLVELSDKIDELNKRANAGELKPSEYEEQFKAIKEQSAKWGASEKDLNSIEKNKVKRDKILKAVENKNKKKK